MEDQNSLNGKEIEGYKISKQIGKFIAKFSTARTRQVFLSVQRSDCR